MRVGGRFVGEVPGVEFLEGGVDVVDVEHDHRRDPLVGVDLDDAEKLHRGTPRAAVRDETRVRASALTPGRNDGRRYVREPDVGDRPVIFDRGISTLSDSGAHHATAVVAVVVVGHRLGHGVPVAGREARPEAFEHLACRVFQPRRLAG